jgi:hypothetical protein
VTQKLATFLVAAAAVLLSGCSYQRVNNRINWTVSHLENQNIKVAIARLGYPTNERVVAGDHVYQWVMGGPAVVAAFASGNGAFATEDDYWCVIELGTDAGGKIIHWTWRGNATGCWRMSLTLPAPPRHAVR